MAAGISIVEGMSSGAIPVAYFGGATDIIHTGVDGYVAVSATQVQSYTRRIFLMTPDEQRTMQQRCKEKSTQFEYMNFQNNFQQLVNITHMMKPSVGISAERLKEWRKDWHPVDEGPATPQLQGSKSSHVHVGSSVSGSSGSVTSAYQI